MKIINITTPLSDADGNPMPDMPVAKLYNQLLGAEVTATPTEAIESIAIGLKFRSADGNVELEDSEISVVRKAIEKNGPQFVAFVIADLWGRLS